jgi:hypothetical protein
MTVKIVFPLADWYGTAILDFSSLFSRLSLLLGPLALITNNFANAQLCRRVEGLVVWRVRGVIITCEMRANLV